MYSTRMAVQIAQRTRKSAILAQRAGLSAGFAYLCFWSFASFNNSLNRPDNELSRWDMTVFSADAVAFTWLL